MKIAVLSDSHDHIQHYHKALDMASVADVIIHCGDLCAPFMIPPLAKLGKPTHIIFGNIDDPYTSPQMCQQFDHLYHHGDLAELDIDGLKIAVTHKPIFAQALAASQNYDLVCFGHSHQALKKKIGKTVLLNPGEIMGRKNSPSFAFFDTKTQSVEFVHL